jgi:hypothetical protein
LKPADTLGNLSSGQVEGSAEQGLVRREWWRWLALPALALLVLEWLVYQRSGVFRLRDWINRRIHAPRSGNPKRGASQGYRS